MNKLCYILIFAFSLPILYSAEKILCPTYKLSNTTSFYYPLSATSLISGGFILTWRDGSQYFSIITPDGNSKVFTVGTSSWSGTKSAVGLQNGQFCILFRGSSISNYYYNRYSSNGTLLAASISIYSGPATVSDAAGFSVDKDGFVAYLLTTTSSSVAHYINATTDTVTATYSSLSTSNSLCVGTGSIGGNVALIQYADNSMTLLSTVNGLSYLSTAPSLSLYAQVKSLLSLGNGGYALLATSNTPGLDLYILDTTGSLLNTSHLTIPSISPSQFWLTNYYNSTFLACYINSSNINLRVYNYTGEIVSTFTIILSPAPSYLTCEMSNTNGVFVAYVQSSIIYYFVYSGNQTIPGESYSNPCLASQFFYTNGSCLSFCQSPLINQTIGVNNKCLNPCLNSEYLLWNSTCSPKCEFPLQSKTDSMGNFCLFVCSKNSYLYDNGSCLPDCPYPFSFRNESGYLVCDIPCYHSEYPFWNDWNKSCLSSCPYPYKVVNHSNWVQCFPPCLSQEYFFQNGSCMSQCPSPWITFNQSGNLFCNFPCQNSDFFYSNGSCLGTCLPPFLPRDGNFCDFACPANQFLDWNSQCRSNCNFPFISKTQNSYNFCYWPCPLQSQYLYWNGSCSEFCDSPLFATQLSNCRFCNYTCSENNFLYWEGSCQQTCPFPFIQVNYSGSLFCEFPCDSESFLIGNDSCASLCPPPNIIEVKLQRKNCVIVPQIILPDFVQAVAALGSSAGVFMASSLATGVNPSLIWPLISLLQDFYYLLFVNLKYPAIFQKFLQIFSFACMAIFPNPFKLTFASVPKVDSPKLFNDNGYSGLFLESAGSAIGLWIYISSLVILVKLLKKKFKIMLKLEKLLLSSFPIKIFLNTAQVLMLGLCLQFKNFQVDSGMKIISFLISIITLLAIIIGSTKLAILFRKSQNNSPWTKSFEEYNLIKSPGKYFPLIGLMKKLITPVILVYLYYLPFHQIIALLIVNSYFLGIFINNPYLKKTDYFYYTVMEVLSFIIHSSVSLFYYEFDEEENETIAITIISFIGFAVFLGVCRIIPEQYKQLKSILLSLKLALMARKSRKFTKIIFDKNYTRKIKRKSRLSGGEPEILYQTY